MPLVAVAPNRHAYGVAGELHDWRAPRGDDRNCQKNRNGSIGIGTPYEVVDLTNALEREYTKSDAHLVAYVLRDPRGAPAMTQPRMNKTGLSFVRRLGYSITIECFFADVDNPGHVAWTDELRAAAREADRRLATAGVYYSDHGRRIVQPLDRPVIVDEHEEVEQVLAAWLRQLRELGIVADEGCQDWTRHFRLPHVRRQGRRFERSEHVDFSRMVPIPPPAPAPLLGRARRPTRLRGELAAAGPIDEAPLAQAFKAAGWLGPSLGRDKRAALCPFRSGHSIGRDFDTSTVVFGSTPSHPLGWWHCSHASCSRRTQRDAVRELPLEARRMVEAAQRELDERPKPAEPARKLVPRGQAATLLEAAFRAAPAGLSVVIAGCGTGKSEAAIAIAGERAAKDGGGPRRAPSHSKTSISVPTTKLAAELTERARARGLEVRRIFGPLSVRREDGAPECAIHECAQAFSRGGLSVPWELCEGRGKAPCEHAETCRARGGQEGPENARVIIGPHALLSRLVGAAGKTGLLVIDEPPPLLKNEVLTSEDLTRAEGDLHRYFEHRYAAALGVSLRALAGWIQTGPLEKPGPLALGVAKVDAEQLEQARLATGAEDAVEAARRAFPELPDDEEGPKPPRSTSPPVERQWAYAARRALYIARAIGEASRVARIVWTALTGPDGGAVARLEERRGRRVLVVTLPDVQLREALRGEHVVVADAGGRQHLDIYQRVVGYDLEATGRVTEVHAGDGAEVKRTHLRRRASRAGWLKRGRLEIDASLVRSIELVVRWLLEEPAELDGRPERAAIVTFKALKVALQAAFGQDVRREWLELGQDLGVLEEARRRIGPIVGRLRRVPDLGHYGGVRGLDHWREHDALVTLGDPWPQIGDARWEGELLSLPDWEGRAEQAARAELEQAHGRLRTVHRERPARALHVGAVRPGGWDEGIEVLDDVGGRPGLSRTRSRDDVRAAVEREGSIRAAARSLGVDERTIRRSLA